MRRTLPISGFLLTIVAAGCTLLVPDPNAAAPAPLSGAPAVIGTPGRITFPAQDPPVTRRAFDPTTPAYPVLLKDLRKLEDADGALILTRGSILDDVAGIAGGKGLIHDPVLDDRPGSLRLRPAQHVLAAANLGPRLIRGIVHREGGELRLEVLSIDPLPVTKMEHLTVDDRIYEPGERLTLSPGLHRISVEAPGIEAVEFLTDTADGPLEVIGRDAENRDGFSTTWIASALEVSSIRAVGFTLFNEPVQGPSLDIRVGPPVEL